MTKATDTEAQQDLHILAVLVENRFGVLARIAGLFSRRGFNIFSLAVAPTDDATLSRIIIVVDVHNTDVAQITKQLDKLVNVLEITELQPATSIERELMLARVIGADPEAVEQLLTQYGGSIVDSNDKEIIVSLHAHPDQLDLCESALHKFGILELQRTGRIALGRLGD
ncbi:MAG: acetolactate synthase small subunit [Actinomycetota bacterium]|nr:acetolactate synthase small subunit [Acidimicrobiales bacterium]MEC7875152.1 acetolactate synthase small subunit [Actinomycetota bacterium]MEC8921639.1 acetolactate synthase small subunit [Actinomycetota bacterium]MEC9268970.1 acetolactate synthase small subunit [Actinomycetota bacterium]MEC9315532.1 acetolactate synthase small subunit [Actinomycetota bacterium]|tara:strand:+ start:295 stop:801 length:507 start_codon:yes stop_codon:yes gene_type:complete